MQRHEKEEQIERTGEDEFHKYLTTYSANVKGLQFTVVENHYATKKSNGEERVASNPLFVMDFVFNVNQKRFEILPCVLRRLML